MLSASQMGWSRGAPQKVSQFFSAWSALCYIPEGDTAKDRESANTTKKGSMPYDVFIKAGTIYDGSKEEGLRLCMSLNLVNMRCCAKLCGAF